MTDTEHFFIQFDNYPGYYLPGQTVMGKVIRVVEEAKEEINYIQLNFRGLATANWVTSTTLPTGNAETKAVFFPHQNEERYFDDLIQLNHHKDGTKFTTLHRGRHLFPFAYPIPLDIPASYNPTEVQQNCRIFYYANATFRAKGNFKSEIRAVYNFLILRPVDLNCFPLSAEPDYVEGEKYLCWFCCKNGPISFKLMLDKTGFLLGERIEFSAEFLNNSYVKIERVDVWISRSVTFVATDKEIRREIWREQMGPKISLPGVPARRTIESQVSFDVMPNHEPFNSFGCSFMKSIYELHVEMVMPWVGKNLTGSLPIVIGVVPFAERAESEYPEENPDESRGTSVGQGTAMQSVVEFRKLLAMRSGITAQVQSKAAPPPMSTGRFHNISQELSESPPPVWTPRPSDNTAESAAGPSGVDLMTLVTTMPGTTSQSQEEGQGQTPAPPDTQLMSPIPPKPSTDVKPPASRCIIV